MATELSKTEGNATLKEHLLQVEKATGIHDARLDGVEIPVCVEHLYDMYWLLRRGRSSMISLVEIDTYCKLFDIKLRAWEILALLRMDHTLQLLVDK